MPSFVHPSSFLPHHSRFRAFTFAEIMFAVMILGIGFILVAAMFPVAIRETQSTVEDLGGITEAHRGESIIQQLGPTFAGTANTTTPGKPYAYVYSPANGSISSPLCTFFCSANATLPTPYNLVKGNLINKQDPRFAWIPVAYQLSPRPVDTANNPIMLDANGNVVPAGDPKGVSYIIQDTAKVWLVAVEKRDPDNPTYTDTDRDARSNTADNPMVITTMDTRIGCFRPKQVYFKLVEGEDPNGFGAVYPDTLVFTSSSGTPTDEPAAAEGAYVWVADDQVTAAINAGSGPNGMYAYNPGDANGRYYRLGTHLPSDTYGQGVWELTPDNDMGIKKDPGTDGLYGTVDDGPPQLENLPPRIYDSAQPYANPSAYSSIPGPAARGYMIGRALKDPTKVYNALTNPYIGIAQDLIALPPITVNLRNQ